MGGVVAEDMEKDIRKEEGRQIVISWVYKNLIVKIIEWLTGKDIDFDVILTYVKEAEDTLKTGRDKASWVADQIVKILPTVASWIVNLLIELAVAYAKKQGWIK